MSADYAYFGAIGVGGGFAVPIVGGFFPGFTAAQDRVHGLTTTTPLATMRSRSGLAASGYSDALRAWDRVSQSA